MRPNSGVTAEYPDTIVGLLLTKMLNLNIYCVPVVATSQV